MSPVLPVKMHSFTFSSRYVTRLLLILLIAFVLFSVGKGQNCGGTPALTCPMAGTYSVNLYESLVIPAGDINASTTGGFALDCGIIFEVTALPAFGGPPAINNFNGQGPITYTPNQNAVNACTGTTLTELTDTFTVVARDRDQESGRYTDKTSGSSCTITVEISCTPCILGTEKSLSGYGRSSFQGVPGGAMYTGATSRYQENNFDGIRPTGLNTFSNADITIKGNNMVYDQWIFFAPSSSLATFVEWNLNGDYVQFTAVLGAITLGGCSNSINNVVEYSIYLDRDDNSNPPVGAIIHTGDLVAQSNHYYLVDIDVTGVNTLRIEIDTDTANCQQQFIAGPTLFCAADTNNPTINPTNDPTSDPTSDPTTDPTADPTTDPTTDPTSDPTTDPTTDPTNDPTIDPTNDPTSDPTTDPTSDPTTYPTVDPTTDPTSDPTIDPTTYPTVDPTESSDDDSSVELVTNESGSGSGSDSDDDAMLIEESQARGNLFTASGDNIGLSLATIVMAVVIIILILIVIWLFILYKKAKQKIKMSSEEIVMNQIVMSDLNSNMSTCEGDVNKTTEVMKSEVTPNEEFETEIVTIDTVNNVVNDIVSEDADLNDDDVPSKTIRDAFNELDGVNTPSSQYTE